VAAILNDTTGCLMSCAWENPKCRIGLIIGTGLNACYVEDLDNVGLWDGDKNAPHHVVINTEWGAFGNNGELDYIMTKWDRRVDALSINPGKQIFEKMISGMYMGEVVRQVLVDLVDEGLVFSGENQDTTNLYEHCRNDCQMVERKHICFAKMSPPKNLKTG
jgi:hexokinase